MRIDIWSDVICPWCYLGARRLGTALDQLGFADEVEVHWRAYQLDPRAPAEPHDLRGALERKYGPGAFERMTTRLTALGRQEGIDYRFDLSQRVNTFDAHCLLAWAGEQGVAAQGQLAERLFSGYFTRGENVADRELLLRAAAECGLDAPAGAVAFDDERFAVEVRDDIAQAMERGITGVPAFFIEDTWLIPGAQEVETMVDVLQRARAKLSARAAVATTVTPEAEACAVDDPNC